MTLTTATASFGPALKRLYPNGLIEAYLKTCPTVGILPKSTDFVGEAKAVVVHLGGGHAAGSFAEAQNYSADAEVRRFLVTRAKKYAIATVDNEAIMASRNDKGAVARALKTQIDSQLNILARATGVEVAGPGNSYRGEVTSVSGQVITLSDARDHVNFELGMALNFIDVSATPDSAGVLQSTKEYPRIEAIDPSTGTLTVDQAVDSTVVFTAQMAVGDKLIAAGDWAQAGTAGIGAVGIGDWLPASAPVSGDSFFGVDRSDHVERLAGVRVSGSGARMEDVVMDTAARVMLNEGRPDTLILNPMKFSELNKSAYSKVQFCEIESTVTNIGFSGMKFPTPAGFIDVLPDPQCPVSTAYMIEKSTWELCSLGELPHFDTADGGRYDRQTNADGIEFRIKQYWNTICKKPQANARITW